MSYKLDDVIIEHGKTLDHIYVIGSGTVSLVMQSPQSIEKFFIGTAGGHGQYKPYTSRHVDNVKEETRAMEEGFPVHNPSDEVVKRHKNAQVTPRQDEQCACRSSSIVCACINSLSGTLCIFHCWFHGNFVPTDSFRLASAWEDAFL